jgi:hypothetical protein
MFGRCCLAFALVLGWNSISSGAVLYSVLDLGTLGGSSSFGWGINNVGQVTGESETERAPQSRDHQPQPTQHDASILGHIECP